MLFHNGKFFSGTERKQSKLRTESTWRCEFPLYSCNFMLCPDLSFVRIAVLKFKEFAFLFVRQVRPHSVDTQQQDGPSTPDPSRRVVIFDPICSSIQCFHVNDVIHKIPHCNDIGRPQPLIATHKNRRHSMYIDSIQSNPLQNVRLGHTQNPSL